MIKKTFLISLALIFLTVFPVNAQTATDSSVTQKIKDRLKETAVEALDTAKEELTAKSKAPRKKAYIGAIKTIDSKSIVLEYKTTNYSIDLTDKTEIVREANLKPNDFIIVMGFLSADNPNLQAYRILLVDEPDTTSPRQLISGSILEIDGNKISVTGKILTINSKTSLEIPNITDPSTEDMELADNLFAIVTLDKNGDIAKVNSVLVLPGKNNPAAQTPTNASEPPAPLASDSATIKTDE